MQSLLQFCRKFAFSLVRSKRARVCVFDDLQYNRLNPLGSSNKVNHDQEQISCGRCENTYFQSIETTNGLFLKHKK